MINYLDSRVGWKFCNRVRFDENGNYLATIGIHNFGKLEPYARTGMKGTAYITFETNTLFGYILSNLFKRYDRVINS